MIQNPLLLIWDVCSSSGDSPYIARKSRALSAFPKSLCDCHKVTAIFCTSSRSALWRSRKTQSAADTETGLHGNSPVSVSLSIVFSLIPALRHCDPESGQAVYKSVKSSHAFLCTLIHTGILQYMHKHNTNLSAQDLHDLFLALAL